MTVAILIGVPEGANRRNAMLALDSIKTGFPTSDIHVYDNNKGRQDVVEEITGKCLDGGLKHILITDGPISHADWLHRMLNYRGKLAVVDGDTVWWSSVEGFKFDAPIAGMFVPRMWNEFSKCESLPRLHTSFLWIEDTMRLKKAMVHSYSATSRYNPCNPFAPVVQFIGGKPLFWDVGANLFHMIGGQHFQKEQLECYDHVNCSSVYSLMLSRIDDKSGFEKLHSQPVNELRGQNERTRHYYERSAHLIESR